MSPPTKYNEETIYSTVFLLDVAIPHQLVSFGELTRPFLGDKPDSPY